MNAHGAGVRGTAGVPSGVFNAPRGGRRGTQFNQRNIRTAIGHQQGAARNAVVRWACAAIARRAFVVEVIGPAVGRAQAMVGRQEIRGAVVVRVVDQCARTGRKTATDNQGDRLVLHLPIVPFRTVDVDVARAAVSKRACRRPFGLQFSLSAEQRAVSLDDLCDFDFARRGNAQGLAVFQHHLSTFHHTQGEAFPFFDIQVIERAHEVRPIAVPHEQFAAFGHIKTREVEAPACDTFCLHAQAPNPHAVLLRP